MRGLLTHNQEPGSNVEPAAGAAFLHHEEPRAPHLFYFLLSKLCVLRGEMVCRCLTDFCRCYRRA